MKTETERVPLPGHEEEYLVAFGVFHQLHCLVRLPPACPQDAQTNKAWNRT